MNIKDFNDLCRDHPLMNEIVRAWYTNALDIYRDDIGIAMTHPEVIFNEYLVSGVLNNVTVRGRFNNESLTEAFNTIKSHLLNNPEVVSYLLNNKLGIGQ